jgi:hypothetical protein
MTIRHVDVFNGDADGLCALHQLRLADPVDATLVTGIKRDTALLERVVADPHTAVTVLDVSLDRNRDALLRILAAGASVRYFDHHFAGAIPSHPGLTAHIDTAGDTCTSAIVDTYLGGHHRAWAVVAAFGDNLADTARRLAAPLGLSAEALETLRALGEALNYNGYGDTLADLHVSPEALYRRMQPFADPLAFHAGEPIARALCEHRRADLALAEAIAPLEATAQFTIHELPDAAWSRRVLGTFAHRLAARDPTRAHAVLRPASDGTLSISVRAPRAASASADALCRRFPNGGGRAAAAGIDQLPVMRRQEFISAFRAMVWY